MTAVVSVRQSSRLWILIICLLLAAAVLAIYWPVHNFGFTQYDDEHYVTHNPWVPKGLTLQGIWWALTTGYFSYWHPLTWMSHMLDVQLFGMRGGGHHLVSVAFHILNSILLFLSLYWMTRSQVKSALVAALFAFHPMHVESVAWIAERKDVLSGFFWILCVWAYAWYAENRAMHRYLIALILFGCGLMAKPMVVTLPCVLFLLDWWPLARFQWARSPVHDFPKRPMASVTSKELLLEKLPFFGGSLLSAGVTYYGVHHAGSIVSEQIFPLGLRLANVPISYVRYIAKLFWPINMTVLYPMPNEWPVWMVLSSTGLLVMLSIPIVFLARRCPYLISGWLWYLGPLVPTIGIVPVGWQSIADRYTYIPFIGLFWMIIWGADDLARRIAPLRVGLALAACVALIPLAIVSREQVGVWKDTRRLFAHGVAVTRNNAIAHYNLGLALYMQGDRLGALQNFARSVAINPKYADANNNLGMLLMETGDLSQATNYFRRALAIKNSELTQMNLVRAMLKMCDLQGAQNEIDPILKANPSWSDGLYFKGVILAKSGKLSEAQGYLEAALGHKPQFEDAQIALGRVLIAKGNASEGLGQLREALRGHPQSTNALRQLAWALATRPDAEVRNGVEALPKDDPTLPSKLQTLIEEFRNRKPRPESADRFEDL